MLGPKQEIQFTFMTLPPDYHLHTLHCGHASGSVEAMVLAALDQGLSEIGFAEHLPFPEGFKSDVPGCVVAADQWGAYLADVRAAQERFGRQIRIRLGAEVDYLPGYESVHAARLAEQPYDVVFGSVHLVNGVTIDFSEEHLAKALPALGGWEGLWKTYWDRCEGLIRSGLCDVLAHLDLPKKLDRSFPLAVNWERVEGLLDRIRFANLTMEVNTGGIDRSVHREPYPGERILRMAAAKGIDVLISSDAHHPREIGRHFRETASQLAALGWRRLAVFEGREKSLRPIEEWF